jgi:rRNA-processing protein EBP2
MNVRLHEVKQNFYNRLESKRLIKKAGRIPFTEHMTITSGDAIKSADAASSLRINDDIKREIAFYNTTRENVMKGMNILVQAKVPISRPDDFFAEMLKDDTHMAKVKSKLLKQQHKI